MLAFCCSTRTKEPTFPFRLTTLPFDHTPSSSLPHTEGIELSLQIATATTTQEYQHQTPTITTFTTTTTTQEYQQQTDGGLTQQDSQQQHTLTAEEMSQQLAERLYKEQQNEIKMWDEFQLEVENLPPLENISQNDQVMRRCHTLQHGSALHCTQCHATMQRTKQNSCFSFPSDPRSWSQ